MVKPQFSLSSLLLAAAIAAAAIALFMARQEIARLERQRQQIVEETGYLLVDDPTKVYLREQFSPAQSVWRYQLYLPAEHDLTWGIGYDLPPGEDYPTKLVFSMPESQDGLQPLTISVFQQGDSWRVSVMRPHSGTVARVFTGDLDWLVQQEKDKYQIQPGGEPLHGPVQVFAPTECIPLLVLRNRQPPDSDLSGRRGEHHGLAGAESSSKVQTATVDGRQMEGVLSPHRDRRR